MKILVCISKTPDTTAKIAFTDNNTKLDTSNVNWIINPYDEWYALVKALELKETNADTLVHLVHVGLADSDAIIRKAFAIGGDEAYRINSDAGDSFFIASQIAAVAKEGNYDIILTGKETIDSNSGVVGGMVAELLDLPYVGLANHFSLEGTTAHITREIEGGTESVSTSLPIVVNCQKGMAEQRIPNMKGIMGSRSKTIHVKEPIEVDSLTHVESYGLPPEKTGVKLFGVDEMEELARVLHEEAKAF